MENLETLKRLWLMRFEQIRKAEGETAWQYQELLTECLLAGSCDSRIVQNLQRLIKDERRHSTLADDLIAICRENHPEIGLL